VLVEQRQNVHSRFFKKKCNNLFLCDRLFAVCKTRDIFNTNYLAMLNGHSHQDEQKT
jgi:hypothetical protein